MLAYKLIMKQVQAGFLCLSLLALVEGTRPPFKCPANYIPTPNDPNTCIRFNTNPLSFDDARTACQADGGDLLRLNPGNFDNIRLLADANKGALGCNFWVGTREGTTNGVWSALNGGSIPASPFFNPTTDVFTATGAPSECGFLNQGQGYYLQGDNCAALKCSICQRNKTS